MHNINIYLCTNPELCHYLPKPIISKTLFTFEAKNYLSFVLDEVGAGVVGLGAAGERALELARRPRLLVPICFVRMIFVK